ncbi:hypothetical protein, partial [Brevibacterium sediminis]|uniref:hypothetical protein n=1 Tax=Brevibacterium sediminis TaxID=1857024 RepID=UPI003B3BCCE2
MAELRRRQRRSHLLGRFPAVTEAADPTGGVSRDTAGRVRRGRSAVGSAPPVGPVPPVGLVPTPQPVTPVSSFGACGNDFSAITSPDSRSTM